MSGQVGVVGPVQSNFGGGRQPRRDVVQQAHRSEHLVAVQRSVVVVERPEGTAIYVLVRIAFKLVHGAVGVLVGIHFETFPATGPAIKQAFVEIAFRLTNFGRVQAEIIQIGEGHIHFDFIGHVDQRTHVDGGLSQVAVVDAGREGMNV